MIKRDSKDVRAFRDTLRSYVSSEILPLYKGALRLGFPVYFAVLLGVWRILGAIAILLPRFPLLKEWAYAGIFFDLTGAAVASAATGLPWWHVAAPLVITLVAVLSWSLRPHTGQ